MKSLRNKILSILFLVSVTYLILCKSTYAASMNMSISKTSGYVGDTFSVTISGINGKVYISSNSNISISNSGSQWVDGSLTITGTAKSVGTGTITVTPEDVTTTAADPEEVTSSASRSITIKEKEVEQPSISSNTTQTSTTQTETSQSETTNTKSKPATSQKKTTTTQSKITTQNKTIESEPEEETIKQSEDFYISILVLNGINKNGEYIEIKLDPEFNKDTYEYECTIGYDIDKIEIQKDAGEFTDCIVITGLEEIKEGENIIKVELIEEGYETKTYTIKIIKEGEGIIEEQDTLEIKQEKLQLTVSMPLWIFLVMESAMIIIEAIIVKALCKKNRKH